jgi:hypothetical protein
MTTAHTPLTGACWECLLPLAEARWLTGPTGPLVSRSLPGRVDHDGNGLVGLDQTAFNSLWAVDGDGRTGWDGPGDAPVIHFGAGERDTYPLSVAWRAVGPCAPQT